MCLTSQALADRKWSNLPQLREALEGLRLGPQHYGYSTASYSHMERIADVWNIALLAIDNTDKLRDLKRDECVQDLFSLQEEISNHAKRLSELAYEVGGILVALGPESET